MDLQDARDRLEQKLVATRRELQPHMQAYRLIAEFEVSKAIDNLDSSCFVAIAENVSANHQQRLFFAEMLAVDLQKDGFKVEIRDFKTSGSLGVLVSGW